MTIRTRAELDKALWRVLVGAIADDEPHFELERETSMVTIAPLDRAVARLDIGPDVERRVREEVAP